MRVIGDKDVFAIEYELLFAGKENYYGNIWFWLNGKRLGAEDKDTFLSYSTSYLKQFIENKESRRFIGSEKIPAQYMFFILYERFYVDSYLFRMVDYNEAGIYRKNFSLETVGQENFIDDLQLLLIDEPAANRQRFLWKLFRDNKLEEHFIPYGYFEEVAFAFIAEIEKDVAEWASVPSA